MTVEAIVSSPENVCLVGGASLSDGAIASIFKEVALFVGVDRGADHLLAAGIRPAAVIGDLDSLSNDARTAFAAALCHVAEQSTTDFEKALSRVVAPAILCLGFTGGRIDHALSVLNAMARFPDKAVILVDDDDVSFVVALGVTTFDAPADMRVSVMPLGTATVSMDGVQWPFSEEDMTLDGFTSPSNAASGGEVTIETNGPVLVTLPRPFLQTAVKAAARVK